MRNFVRSERICSIAVIICSFCLFATVVALCGGFGGIEIVERDYNPSEQLLAAPVFSHESGFYDEPFYLEINAPEGTKIFYTLDCSDPDEHSLEYTGPIYLEDATQHENVYSMRTDVSTGFYSNLIQKYQTLDADPEYVAPDFKVEKCNVVRVRLYSKDGKKSDIFSKSYFVGMMPSEFGNVNVVTVTTDPDNLFSDDKGIYVTGSSFSEYLKKGSVGQYWRFWTANYRQKGKAWQRDASFSFFNSTGNLICEKQDGAIRTQGGVSRGTVPRSLNLFADDGGNTDTVFYADFFKTGFQPQAVTLASGGNRLWTKMNDVFITDRCKELNFATMNYAPYVLFLDGEYWGFYWLAEKYDETYLSYYYGVDADNVLIIKNGQVDVGDEVYKSLYAKMLDEISALDMNQPDAYQRAFELVDIDSFIDYYATMAYIARQEDWPMSNFALWRTVEIRDDKYSDGKWRWLMFDCNSTSMNAKIIGDDSISYIVANDELFASFWNNAEFRNQFLTRLKNIQEDCFDSQSVIDYIDQYDKDMRDILQKSWTRFHGLESDKMRVYETEMSGYKKFFIERFAEVESWMK